MRAERRLSELDPITLALPVASLAGKLHTPNQIIDVPRQVAKLVSTGTVAEDRKSTLCWLNDETRTGDHGRPDGLPVGSPLPKPGIPQAPGREGPPRPPTTNCVLLQSRSCKSLECASRFPGLLSWLLAQASPDSHCQLSCRTRIECQAEPRSS